jgi:hypothetical protein
MKRDYLESLGLGHLPDEAITLAEKYENPAAMTFAGIVIQLEAFELAMHGINTAASASELNAYSVIYDGEISLRHMMR